MKKTIEFKTPDSICLSLKKYKSIRKGSLVQIKHEESKTRYPNKTIYAIKGFNFTDRNTAIVNGSIGIVIGYKYRRMRHRVVVRNNKQKSFTLVINVTKWFQVLIEKTVYLISDCDVYPIISTKNSRFYI